MAKKKDLDNKSIGISIEKEKIEEIERRAASMHLSVSKYVKLILADWIESGKKLKLEER